MADIKRAVIPAAGHGTRLRPLTYGVPKELLLLNNKPLIHYCVDECIKAEVEEIAVIINKKKEGIKKYLKGVFDGKIRFKFIYQEEATGLADAILLAENFLVNAPFFILFPDVVLQGEQNLLIDLSECYLKYGSPAAALISTEGPAEQIGIDYGFIEFEADDESCIRIYRLYDRGSIKKTRLKMTGRAVWDHHLLKVLHEHRIKDKYGEFSEVPALQHFMRENKFYGVKLSGIAYDCGTINGLKLASHDLSSHRVENISEKNVVDFSAVIPVYNEEEVLPQLCSRLIPVLQSITESYEVIFVDDGSHDRSWAIIQDAHSKNPRIKGLKLSRNFGHHIALTAGIDSARGEAIVLMDADLQDPPEEIPRLYEKFKEGYDMVNATRAKRDDPLLKRLGSRVFLKILKLISNIEIDLQTGIFRILSKRATTNIRRLREQSRFMVGLMNWVGLKKTSVRIERHERYGGETKYSPLKLLRLAWHGVTSFSYFPLQIASLFGFIVSIISFSAGIYMIYRKLFFGVPILGYASIVVSLFFLGGFILLMLGTIGEYIGRIYTEVQNRPLYIVEEKFGEFEQHQRF